MKGSNSGNQSKPKKIKRDVQRLLQVPAQKFRIHDEEESSQSDGDIGAVTYISSLSPNTKNLNILWNDYEVVLVGKKTEKVFSTLERGQVKEKYSKRKVVWDFVSYLVLAGQSSNTVTKNIYSI